MKKEMLKHNVIFYGIQYSLSLLFVGFELGQLNWTRFIDNFSLRNYSWLVQEVLTFLAIPAIYLILMLIGQSLFKEQEYSTGKSYYVMAASTLAYSAWVWVKLYEHYNRLHARSVELKLGSIIYPAIMAFFSVVIAAFYIICAVKTRKENRKYKR